MIMTVKTPGSQMGSPAAAERGGEARRGDRGESGERNGSRVDVGVDSAKSEIKVERG